MGLKPNEFRSRRFKLTGTHTSASVRLAHLIHTKTVDK